MIKLPEPGMYRTTRPYPSREQELPAGVLVFIGAHSETGMPFVVRPGANRNNRWYWGEPTVALRALAWTETLTPLRPEGFYTLPEELAVGSSGRWLKGAIVQLGYDGGGRGILFVGEQHEEEPRNVLVFAERGVAVEDALIERLIRAPILFTNPPSGSH